MKIKEALNFKINNSYKIISDILQTSDWAAEEIINGDGVITLNNLQKLFDEFGLDILVLDNKPVKHEISTNINNRSFKNYASYWLLKKKYEVKESTWCNYCNHLKNNIIPFLGDILFEDFNNNLIQQFAYWASEKGGKNGKGLSEKSIRDCVLLLKEIIRDGQDEKVFPEFIMKNIKIPKTYLIESTRKVYSKEEYKKIVDEILKDIDCKKLGILIGIYTGMRIGELCALKWEDINLSEKYICVNKTLQRVYNPLDEFEKSKIIVTSAKTQSSIRNIPITDEMVNICKTLRRNLSDYVLSGNSKCIEPRTYRKFYNKFMISIGIEPIKFHSLRHTFASMSIENGEDVKTISEILGHSDVSITLSRYTHISEQKKLSAIEKFNNIFNSKEEKAEFVRTYKGNVCCLNKKTGKCDFIGSIKDVSEYIAESARYVCDVINGIVDDKVYFIIPKIIGITHDENDKYVGG